MTQSFACIGGKGFLPQNNLYIPDDQRAIQGISQTDFDEVLDKIADVYTSEVARFGGTLRINRKWTDGTVNAMAYREGKTYHIDMFGGLARHSSITKDAFALVACHEIGHHIGGAPKYSQSGNTWASTEGQSDYFATMKCLRKVFLRDDNQQIVSAMTVDPVAAQKCAEKHTEPNELAICKRISMAGFSGASMFAVIQNQNLPKFDSPDPSVVSQTYESHPQFQCRLDTYFNGAVCDVSEDIDLGNSDPKVGACNQSATVNYGFRPLCWYKPSGSNPNPDPNPNPTPAGIAKTPTANGMVSVNSNNPNTMIPLVLDVSNFTGAANLAVEVSKPNKQFANPNGTSPDQPNGLFVQVYKRTQGTYNLLPAQQLPSWGTYQIRVISLDPNQKPVSRNSNSFILNLRK